MTDPVTIVQDGNDAVRDMAHFILAFIEGHPAGYLAAIHAATIVMTSMAIEEPDPEAALAELLGDISNEARAMMAILRSGTVHDA